MTTMLSTLDANLPDETWDTWLARRRDAHILQHRMWGELKARFGWHIHRVALADGDEIVAGAQVLLRRLPWSQSLAYIPKGPILDWDRAELAHAVLEAIESVARRARAAVLLMEPDLVDGADAISWLAGKGWRQAPRPIQPRSTIVIELDDDEVMLARMKSKWRYNVRLSARKGVTVRPGSRDDLPAVYALMRETARRDGFAIHTAGYYEAAYELFVPLRQAEWLLAEHQGRLLAAIVVFAHGDRAWYFWGASASRGRNLMPNHALQWAAMRWARDRGCRLYDLWGIPDEVGQNPAAYTSSDVGRSGGLWGVYRFKQGFGGRVVRFAGAWEKPISRPGYAFYRLGWRLRRGEA
ncbi:MAG TPA: peptidoglycan bridge formation glycyltransferase FemA/FemB family protein [Caldilineae bacterium]|nr:peptidoglycan bridge formation glycyltransferase FemA/FemB family protein [Caldilineae bacterium]